MSNIEIVLAESVNKILASLSPIGVRVSLNNVDDTYYLNYNTDWAKEEWEEHFMEFSTFALRASQKYFLSSQIHESDSTSLSVDVRIGNLFDFLAQ